MNDADYDALVERVKAATGNAVMVNILTCHNCHVKSEPFDKAPMVSNTKGGFKTHDNPDGWYVIFAERGDFSGTKYFCSDNCKDGFKNHRGQSDGQND